MTTMVLCHKDALCGALQTGPKEAMLALVLGRDVHGMFVPGVTREQLQRMLARLKTNTKWSRAPPCSKRLLTLTPGRPPSLLMKTSPFHVAAIVSEGPRLDVPCEACHVFEHKAWRFVLAEACCWSSLSTVDRDDDRQAVHLVELQLIGPSSSSMYVAESGLLLVQDLANMCCSRAA
jgi:hypothetical protein